jgi:hypothetical protein
LVVADLVE